MTRHLILRIRNRLSGGNVDSQCHLPQNWLLDSWRVTVATNLNNDQAIHLVNWGTDAEADKINAVDLVRIVQWASTADNPWQYLASNVPDLYRLGPDGETLESLLRRRTRASHQDGAIRICSKATCLPSHRHPQRQSGTKSKATAGGPRRIHQIVAARRPVALGNPPTPEPHPAVGSVPAQRHRTSED